jgi:hypothetical protein
VILDVIKTTFYVVGDDFMVIPFKKSCLAKINRCGITPHKTVYPKSVKSSSRRPHKIDNVFYYRWSFLRLSCQAELNNFFSLFDSTRRGRVRLRGLSERGWRIQQAIIS